MSTPEDFIRLLPHISFVQGQKNIDFLSKRYNKISKLPAFENMEYTEDAKTIQRWSPLIMKGREKGAFASTKMDGGTDVNFGKLTVKMMEFMQKDDSVNVLYNSEVTSVRENKQKQWDVCVRNSAEGWIAEYTADFLFIGAGGMPFRYCKSRKSVKANILVAFRSVVNFYIVINRMLSVNIMRKLMEKSL